ncbi:ATPase AAA-2 domain protein [Chloroherpeton thalassium ATCC 35110]|uniref:ATPase AAA-2 domain protein n=1 Tax=Chloroherpeton thalassium (strain ATCC 35110 / GB-78) TaxID=517418 RepID=B3QUJ2_CHLT3|nr:AAA family ATPase [Chloroherpeton thalassium]ACF12898.1 ATPase AAA-2 domain protein [Chloroherpeton thalassium ATCC 35110]
MPVKDTLHQDIETRLAEIDQQLANLREEQERIQAKWQSQKELIMSIRKLKSDIEEAKVQAEEFERQGNYGKVAELRYGKITQLEKELEQGKKKVEALRASGNMLMKEDIESKDIADVVSKWTGIPVSKMLQSERQKILNIEDELRKRVIGQREAIHAVSEAVKRARAGLSDEKRPIGSFIFLGTTGVGKTELARSLAAYLFNDEDAMVRIDMSEYMEAFNVSRLVGAPPGYVGYEEGGQLTEAVRRKPFSVVLLDEIEKAHPDVFNILLQVLDDGRLTDNKGHTVNFRNTIIIMTSNLGSHLIQEEMAKLTDENKETILPELRAKLFDLMRKSLRPEFLNRVDETILFTPLTREDLKQIVDIQFERIRQTAQKQNILLRITDEAKNWLGQLGYDPHFGARPLKRVMQRYITNELAEKILGGEVSDGDSIEIVLENNQLVFRKN